MPSAGVINGSVLRAYKSVSSTMTAVGHSTNATLNISRDTLELADKDNVNDWKEYQVSGIGATLTVDGFISEDTTNVSPTDLLTDLINGTSLSMQFTTNVNGDSLLTFSAYCVSVDFNAPDKELSTASFQFQITGAITVGTVTT